MKGISGLKNTFGRPVLSEAIYSINFSKSLNGLSRTIELILTGKIFDAYINAVLAPIDLPQSAISSILFSLTKKLTTLSKSLASFNPSVT
jgi:hypothetical protein